MDWLETVTHCEPLPVKEQHELIELWQKHNDIEARNKLIMSNVKYAVTVSRRYTDSTLPLNDLINQCMLGLIKAVDEFDLNKKNKNGKSFTFLTYGYWHMLKYIKQYMLVSKVIKQPSNVDSLKKYKSVHLFSEHSESMNGTNIPEHSYHVSDTLQIEDELDYLFEHISDRSRKIVLSSINGMTYKQIGKKYKISRARVYQIFHDTCAKIRETKTLVRN